MKRIIILLLLIFSLYINAFSYNKEDYSVVLRDLDNPDRIVSAINVKDFGAVGDGIKDDTEAFLLALEEARQYKGVMGATVFVPVGKYRVTQPLFLGRGVNLIGVWQNPNNFLNTAQTFIFAEFGQSNDKGDSVINLSVGSCVRNINFFYPGQHIENVIKYPPTITAVVFGSIENITFINSYRGIETTGSYGGSAHYISNIFGTVLKEGIHLDRNYEVSEVVNIKFDSKYWASFSGIDEQSIRNYTKQNCIGINMGKVDDAFIYNLWAPDNQFYRGVNVYYNSTDIANPPKIAYGFLMKLNQASYFKEDKQDVGMPILRNIDNVKNSDKVSHIFAKERHSSKETLFNVSSPPYNAVADGKTDDTQAIEKALNNAKLNGGGTVFFTERNL